MDSMLRQLDTVVGKEQTSEAGDASAAKKTTGEMGDASAAKETTGEMGDASAAKETTGEMGDTSAAQETTGEAGHTSAAQETSGEMMDTSAARDTTGEAGDTSAAQETTGEMMDTSAAQETSGEAGDTSAAQETTGEMMDTSAAPEMTGEMEDTSAAQETAGKVEDSKATAKEVPSKKQEPVKIRGPDRPMAVGERVIRRTGAYSAAGMTFTLHRPLSGFDRMTMQPLKERLPLKMPAFSKWLSDEKFLFTYENEKLAEKVHKQSERYDANRLTKTIIEGRLRNAIIDSQIAAGLRKAPEKRKKAPEEGRKKRQA